MGNFGGGRESVAVNVACCFRSLVSHGHDSRGERRYDKNYSLKRTISNALGQVYESRVVAPDARERW